MLPLFRFASLGIGRGDALRKPITPFARTFSNIWSAKACSRLPGQGWYRLRDAGALEPVDIGELVEQDLIGHR
jgi:hypothetical protein